VIQKSEWYWLGYAGHFIGASDCRFHLATIVGKYLVSTVGDYHPLSLEERQIIGVGRYFETMVFKCEGLDDDLDPIMSSLQRLDSLGYNDSGDAERGHYAMCEKWARE